MRTLLALVLVLALLVGAIAVYLVVTTPGQSAGVHFPLDPGQRALLARVPASADAFALIPTAAPLQKKLLANPVTREPIESWIDSQQIPGPWLLGGADIAAWRSGKETGYAIRVDALRALLVRTWLLWTGGAEARWDGTAFVINDDGGPRIDAATLDALLQLGAGLPRGDLFAVQRNRSRGAFPPIGRPAISSVTVTGDEIGIVSRANATSVAGAARAPAVAMFPANAMLAVTFHDPPRMVGDLQRLTGIDVASLASGGGSIVLYDVDAGTLLPRPKGLVAVPADDARRATVSKIAVIAELVGQTRDTGRELLVSFDRASAELYLKDGTVRATWPATSWAVRIDPRKLVPVLEKLGDSTGLRLASGRLHRAARDLRRWISWLEQAKSIEAAASEAAGTEELRVRIATK